MEEVWNDVAKEVPHLWSVGENLGVALLILIAGWWLAAVLGGWVRSTLLRAHLIDDTIVPMFQSAVVWAVRIFTLVAVLARFGVQTTSIIAVLGAAGLAIGLALQGTLQNIAAGIMLIILRPLRAGERIELSTGLEGTVDEVGLFLTRIIRYDGVMHSVPNSTVWNATITNYSRNETRRLDIPLFINYGRDLDEAVSILHRFVSENPRILDVPKPEIMALEHRDAGTQINVRAWTKAADFWEVRWGDLTRRIRKLLTEAGFGPYASS